MADEAREYEALKRRGFKPYSLGHRLMYDVPILLMTRSPKSPTPFAILEAGFGVGVGLDLMVKGGLVASYLGFEPDKDSYGYVAGRHKDKRIKLVNGPFEFSQTPQPIFDAAFCVEVIEHIEPQRHQGFLVDLRSSLKPGGTLWLSTPDKATSSHGARTATEWTAYLRAAGFGDVISFANMQWTSLFVCQ